MAPTVPDDPSIKWMLGVLIVALIALLGYVVKAVIDKIGPGQDRIATGFDKLISAVEKNTDAVREMASSPKERSHV